MVSKTIDQTPATSQSTSQSATSSDTTQNQAFDIANRPFNFVKDTPGTEILVTVTVSNPISVSGTITAPNGQVNQITDIGDQNGVYTLKFSVPSSWSTGTYVLLVKVDKGPDTSPTSFSEIVNSISP